MELHEFSSGVREELSSKSTFEKDNENENNVVLYLHLRDLDCSKPITLSAMEFTASPKPKIAPPYS